MGGYGDVQCIDENGIRLDGRTKDEVRPVSVSYTHLTLPTICSV